jgi:hypothetical protein
MRWGGIRSAPGRSSGGQRLLEPGESVEDPLGGERMSTRSITFRSTGQSVVRLSKEEKKRMEREKEQTARRQEEVRERRTSKSS